MSSVSILHFPPSTDSPRRARHDVVELLHRSGVGGVDDIAALLTSELVTNSVLHAGTPVAVRCEIDEDRVRVAVSDDNPAGLQPGPLEEMAEHGRGVQIVSALADAWGTDVAEDDGKSVWFELAVRGSGPGPGR